jgi:hypothetical protein
VRGPDEGGDLGGGGEGGSTSACRRRPEMDVLVGGTASCGEKGGLPRTPRESLEGGLSARKFTGRRSRSGETGANDNDGYTELTLTAAVWLRLVHFGVPLGTPSPVWRIDWPIRPLKRLAPPQRRHSLPTVHHVVVTSARQELAVRPPLEPTNLIHGQR